MWNIIGYTWKQARKCQCRIIKYPAVYLSFSECNDLGAWTLNLDLIHCCVEVRVTKTNSLKTMYTDTVTVAVLSQDVGLLSWIARTLGNRGL
jgi:hypothetical protein